MAIQPIGTQPVYQLPEVEKVAPVQPVRKVEQGEHAGQFDRYTPEDGADRETAGLYWIEHDEEGNPVVRMDGNARPESEPSAPKAEQTTTNTDQVDRELEQLRKELEQLQKQLSTAAPEQREALERQASQVERELAQKDNDSYRRQHAVVT